MLILSGLISLISFNFILESSDIMKINEYEKLITTVFPIMKKIFPITFFID